jgi:chitinase
MKVALSRLAFIIPSIAFFIGTPASAQVPNYSPWVSAYYLGYFWDWSPTVTDAVRAVDMTTMTHLVFARYAPGAGTRGGVAGQLVGGAGTGHTKVEQPLIDKAHANSVKAIMMIGGAGDGAGWVASTRTAALRTTFITNILAKVSRSATTGWTSTGRTSSTRSTRRAR